MSNSWLKIPAACAIVFSVPAHATAMNYVIEATLDSGDTIRGHMTFDDGATNPNRVTDVSLDYSGRIYAEATGYEFTYGNYAGSYYQVKNDYVMISFFGRLAHPILRMAFKGHATSETLRSLEPSLLSLEDSYLDRAGRPIEKFTSGSIALASTGAVPEPSTWALMILGFGAVGYALRRKKAVVRFA